MFGVDVNRTKARNFGFDNIFEATLTLFECLSLEGFTDVADYVGNLDSSLVSNHTQMANPTPPHAAFNYYTVLVSANMLINISVPSACSLVVFLWLFRPKLNLFANKKLTSILEITLPLNQNNFFLVHNSVPKCLSCLFFFVI